MAFRTRANGRTLLATSSVDKTIRLWSLDAMVPQEWPPATTLVTTYRIGSATPRAIAFAWNQLYVALDEGIMALRVPVDEGDPDV